MIEAFGQLSSVSAVLGGFALTFLGVVVSGAERTASRELTAALALFCSATFVLCALGWSLIAVWLASPLAPIDFEASSPQPVISVHTMLSPIFLFGICLLFWTLGACGWMYSKRLGVISSLTAVLATFGAYLVLTPFLVVA